MSDQVQIKQYVWVCETSKDDLPAHDNGSCVLETYTWNLAKENNFVSFYYCLFLKEEW